MIANYPDAVVSSPVWTSLLSLLADPGCALFSEDFQLGNIKIDERFSKFQSSFCYFIKIISDFLHDITRNGIVFCKPKRQGKGGRGG